jgi:class 3 adenylate cyclase
MGLHTDAAEPRGGTYVGMHVLLTARLAKLARGGQILLSASTQELVKDTLPPNCRLRDLGEYRMRELNVPEHVFQLVALDLPDDAAADRVLATILFTDIVNSTATAAALGDRPWRALLADHHAIVRESLPRFRGRQIRSTGDGVFAAFDTPTRAIQCANAIGERVHRIGIEVRAGVHTGECELVGDVLEGVAVHIAARIAGAADGNEVLVSSTPKELVAGSTIAFTDRGFHVFKGLPGEWHLFSVQQTAGSACGD